MRLRTKSYAKNLIKGSNFQIPFYPKATKTPSSHGEGFLLKGKKNLKIWHQLFFCHNFLAHIFKLKMQYHFRYFFFKNFPMIQKIIGSNTIKPYTFENLFPKGNCTLGQFPSSLGEKGTLKFWLLIILFVNIVNS